MNGEIKEYLIKVKSIETEIESEHNLRTIESRNDLNGHILWTIEFDFFDKVLHTKPNHMLSSALNEIRKKIEPEGFRIGVRWSEIDAHHSGMLGDMTAGSAMYYAREIEEINKKANYSKGYPSYHILEKTEFVKVVSLDDQNNYMKEWSEKLQEKLKPRRNWFQRLLNK